MKLYIKQYQKAALLSCFLFLSSVGIGLSQSRFNMRIVEDYNFAVFHGVDEVDGGYNVIGNGLLEADPINQYSMFHLKFDQNGNLINVKDYVNEVGFFQLNDDPGSEYLNAELKHCVMGVTYSQTTDSGVGFLASFDDNGDTIKVIEFNSPYMALFDESYDFNTPQEMSSSSNSDNSVFIASNIFQPETTGNDCYIQRITPEGETLWEYIYATNANPDACYAMLPTEEGGVLAFMFEANVNDNYMVELGDSGSVLQEGYSQIDGIIREVIWSDDNNIFGVGSGQSEDEFITGRMFKMDTFGEVIWDTIIGLGENLFFQNQFYKVVHSQDGAYVAGGTKKEFLPEEEQTDATGITRSNGWLVKINDDGEVQWERKYHFIDSPQDKHTLNDLKATSDGGYIFCGESTDEDSDQEFTTGPRQQGWLVKVDEHGCLVEGCQLTDNINVIEQDGAIEYFKAGPIPAGDFLNIYQSVTANLSTYQLINSQGQVVEEFPSMSKGTTMMLDVSNYATGGYQLILTSRNQVLQNQKILIE